jgi:hypothetical protein
MRSGALIFFSVARPARTHDFDESFSSRPPTKREHPHRECTAVTLPHLLRNGIRNFLTVAVVTASLSCKSDDTPLPTATTNPLDDASLAVAAHISAPRPLTPVDGTEISDGQPTLTVENATVTDDSTVTYRFEVATDSNFDTIVASNERIAQGDKETSWRVTPPLDNDPYFWRARAENARNVAGPYAAPFSFTVTNAGDVVFDSLMDGTSSGEVGGGKFIAQGWQVTTKSDFIRYAVPTIESGFVEWENIGLRTTNPAPDNVMLLGMWDGSPEAGPYRTNAYRVHLRKLDATLEPPFLRLRWIANGEQHDTGANVQFWDPGRVYRWRVEWGPGPLGNAVQVFLDDVPIILQQYTRDYAPKRHWIELGVEERRESIVGVVYSNVRIGRR